MAELVPNLDALVDALDRNSPARDLMAAFREPTAVEAERALRALVEAEASDGEEVSGTDPRAAAGS